ncbi:hypothetical protein FRX31_011882 [Thalictrum thalictroides]|uniref:Uncharacterized protein n=1 Tax=Thalictrum thalictroides TaxID=46969 RepID=A0A7J6WPM9_THATH|nr:hypothetical protein FRX31_011882 [Thalictrum thalictroides]
MSRWENYFKKKDPFRGMRPPGSEPVEEETSTIVNGDTLALGDESYSFLDLALGIDEKRCDYDQLEKLTGARANGNHIADTKGIDTGDTVGEVFVPCDGPHASEFKPKPSEVEPGQLEMRQ